MLFLLSVHFAYLWHGSLQFQKSWIAPIFPSINFQRLKVIFPWILMFKMWIKSWNALFKPWAQKSPGLRNFLWAAFDFDAIWIFTHFYRPASAFFCWSYFIISCEMPEIMCATQHQQGSILFLVTPDWLV